MSTNRQNSSKFVNVFFIDLGSLSNRSLIEQRSGPIASTTWRKKSSLVICILTSTAYEKQAESPYRFRGFFDSLTQAQKITECFRCFEGLRDFLSNCSGKKIQNKTIARYLEKGPAISLNTFSVTKVREIELKSLKWRRQKPTNKICLPKVVMPPSTSKGYPPGLFSEVKHNFQPSNLHTTHVFL